MQSFSHISIGQARIASDKILSEQNPERPHKPTAPRSGNSHPRPKIRYIKLQLQYGKFRDGVRDEHRIRMLIGSGIELMLEYSSRRAIDARSGLASCFALIQRHDLAISWPVSLEEADF